MKLLERLSMIAEFNRQPVEQFGMSWRFTHVPEIIQCSDQATSEVMMPDAIHNGSPREGILRIGQPTCECGSAL